MKSSLEPGDRRDCSVCVMEPFLSGEIEKDGKTAACSYCEEEGNTFSVDQIATSVGLILGDFYHRTYNDHDTAQPEGQPLQSLISELAEVTHADFAEDVRSVLAERHAREWEESALSDDPFAADVRYAKNNSVDAWNFEKDWFVLENSLKTETRYFNKDAEYTLTSIFDGIDEHHTISERPVIVEAGPGTGLAMLYRAREFQTERELREAMKRPDIEVGPPPSAKAIAGRMKRHWRRRLLCSH